jgi:hypothetical protein
LQDTQAISRTICLPVVICRSSGGPSTMLTLHSQRGFQVVKYTLWRRGRLCHVGLGMPTRGIRLRLRLRGRGCTLDTRSSALAKWA